MSELSEDTVLRQRAQSSLLSEKQECDVDKLTEEVVWGKTPAGVVFPVPTTYDVLTNLFYPTHPKSHLDLFNLSLLALQVLLFFSLPRTTARAFFMFYFAFWRCAYDLGLGWILTKQSKKRWIVREVQKRGWLDENKRPLIYSWIRNQLQGKMGKDYSFDSLPIEYNAWLLFRQLVDVILMNDFLSYTLFAFTCFRLPEGLSIWMHILRWAGGLTLIAFNLWVKTEAHHVVKDYGWYWGDCFFERGALVFDGVFEMAPHPMYSVGYAGYYGLSMIAGSYAVLFASLACHAAQFGFLVFFENPHIERMYGQRKLMSLRTPPPLDTDAVETEANTPTVPGLEQLSGLGASEIFSLNNEADESVTEVETSTDTDDHTETEAECEDAVPSRSGRSDRLGIGRQSPLPNSISRSPPSKARRSRARRQSFSQHDLLTRYFRKDPIGFHNIDVLRAGDVQLILLIFYAVGSAITPSLSPASTLAVHFVHALVWRIFHSFGLGSLLRSQSERKAYVKHFIKHYVYHSEDVKQSALEEAFTNWKGLYNLSLCMTYASFIGLAWKTYAPPQTWSHGDGLLRHILGAMLIALHGWTASQSYDVLGVFGWFFGDFFIDDYPATLDYTGIYRYLNNPEKTMSGAALFGMALISGSKLVFALAVISTASHWWFLSNVEDPHMRKVYGPSIRKEAGLTKTIKLLAIKNAVALERGPGRHYAPTIKNVAKEFRGTIDKVYEDYTDVLEEFFTKSRPRVSEVVQEAKVLLQQSAEKLVITPLAQDLSSLDVSKYELFFDRKPLRFHLGEPIRLTWRAPLNHSRKDWIGMYRAGANKDKRVTNTVSLSWLPVHDEEWEGNSPISPDQVTRPETDNGVVEFNGSKLPWHVGLYEIRYHHDKKYNVMKTAPPVEIYVTRPDGMDFDSVRSCLLRIIPWCLDSDPSLLPASATRSRRTGDNDRVESDDDFRFWSEAQAKRIAVCINAAFGVECSHEVILGEANVSALANRILAMRELMDLDKRQAVGV
ncbi:phospholipid methyltransferase-domain-containing protein [Cantharellus anzutake]|uniref:phospholipid methyltransferase-domain-containing protein n=1 Tax=Cantharellus anzutake TaxID=1750568 RepID=UPI001905A49B|nr:phospholipid methyltransferase-domain-containing protein [Cantharellus anzutake]KAF8330188.1 phospholipid methyltransferase-domain-containing protein [Cantharellus anzutake]